MIVVVTGLRREAQIAAGADVHTVVCGGRREILRRRLDAVLDRHVSGIVSFGICAGLKPGLHPGTCIIASETIGDGGRIASDADWSARIRSRLPEAVTGAIADAASILQSAGEKSALFARSGALAADMESHTAAMMAKAKGLPFACLRTVADTASSDLPDAVLAAVTQDGTIDFGAVLGSLVKRPGQVMALIRVRRETQAAYAALFRCRDVLGGRFAGPDFGEPLLDMG